MDFRNGFLQNVCDEVEHFCDIAIDTTDQYVDMRSSLVSRETGDPEQLKYGFSQHNPFPESNEIISISTGVVGDKRINYRKSIEVGTIGIQNTIVKNFDSVSFKRKDRVVHLGAANTSIRINVSISIDLILLFYQMCIVKKSDEVTTIPTILTCSVSHVLFF